MAYLIPPENQRVIDRNPAVCPWRFNSHGMRKVYAKTRQLNATIEKALQDTQTLAYLLSSDQDEAAAAIARTVLETGALGEIDLGADDVIIPAKI